MTTNQTIDGVPRSTLELLLGDKPDHPSAAWKELRDLLDASDHVHEWDINAEGTATVCLCGARSSDEQAEQLAPVATPINYGALDPVERLAVCRGEVAPVAVVMPEFESSFEKWWEEDGQYCRAGGGSYEKTFAYRAYEAALADVTRLNPSL